MFGRLTTFNGSLFEDIRRLEEEMDELFGRWPWPAWIRSVAAGTYPPINVGPTPAQFCLERGTGSRRTRRQPEGRCAAGAHPQARRSPAAQDRSARGMTLMESGPIPRRCDRMQEAARAAARPDCRCEQSHDTDVKAPAARAARGGSIRSSGRYRSFTRGQEARRGAVPPPWN